MDDAHLLQPFCSTFTQPSPNTLFEVKSKEICHEDELYAVVVVKREELTGLVQRYLLHRLTRT